VSPFAVFMLTGAQACHKSVSILFCVCEVYVDTDQDMTHISYITVLSKCIFLAYDNVSVAAVFMLMLNELHSW